MKVQIKRDCVVGETEVPAGEYMVALGDSQRLALTGRGKDIKIAATRRKTMGKSKTTSVAFYSGGGGTWSLVLSTPKHGEWIAILAEKKEDK